MSQQPIFNANALTKLSERTEYETWLLEAIYAIAEQELFPSWPDGVIYPVHKSKPQFITHTRANIIIGDWRSGFLNVGAPLVFVSTFKLLDMLIEWILEETGSEPTYRFQQKLQQLHNSPIFPHVVESRTWLKERLVGLYSTLEPLRGTIIHDKHFTATDGAIRVASSKKGIIGAPVEISAAHLRKLAFTIVNIMKYVDGTWLLDDFREKTLRYHLDELALLHGLLFLGQKRPFHTCVRVYMRGSDPLLVDLMSIHSDLASIYVNQDCSFDLRVLMVREDRVVDAYLFPWCVLAVPTGGWSHTINAQHYMTTIPDDIKPEHLGNTG